MGKIGEMAGCNVYDLSNDGYKWPKYAIKVKKKSGIGLLPS
jgi:hypothetical protein